MHRESDHPLRADPLQSLPDAVLVPRPHPHPHPPPSTASQFRVPVSHPLDPPSPVLSPTLSPSLGDRLALEQDTRRQFAHSTPADPLLAAVLENAPPVPSPPAGNAFATDVDSFLTSLDPERPTSTTAGLLHRADIDVFPAQSEKGSAAGVFTVRSSAAVSRRPHSPSLSSASLVDFHRVKRSLADFSWLQQRLQTKYDGVIVPSLPKLSIAGRIEHGFAHDSERQRGLQRFLRRVAAHPVLSTGDEVLAFLGASGDDAWRKLRRERIIADKSVSDLLFSHGRETSGPLQRIGVWGEKFLWQTGKRFNQGLVWFLERDRAPDTRRPDSAHAKLERLQSYVRDLETNLISVRDANARIARGRAMETSGVLSLREAFRQLANREGGKFGAYFDCEALDVRNGTGSLSVSREREVEQRGQSSNSVDGQREVEQDEELVRQGSANEDLNNGTSTSGPEMAAVGRPMPAIMLDEVLKDFEERARGAQQIMATRQEEQEVYERALATYKKLRDKLEGQTDTIWRTTGQGDNLGGANGVIGAVDGSSSVGSGSSNVGGASGGHATAGERDELAWEVSAAAARLAEVRKHYQVVAVRTTEELRRLRVEIHEDVCESLERVGNELVREHEAHAAAWRDLVHLLGEYRREE